MADQPNLVRPVGLVGDLRTRIRAGEWVGRQKLPSERQLQQLLGASRPAIREALKMIEAEGLIEIRAKRGAYVRQAPALRHFAPPDAAAADVLEVRALLEPRAAYLATRYATGPWLTRIRAFLEYAGEPKLALAAAGEFHVLCAQAGGNIFLAQLIAYLADLTRRDSEAYSSPDLHQMAQEQHWLIYEHILAGDADAAYSASYLHVTGVAARYGEQRRRRP